MRRPLPSAFDLTSGAGVDDEVYDGLATINIGADDHDARVRLIGHIDPIDGRYDWQGMVFESLPANSRRLPVSLMVGDRIAAARIAERTPWGSYSVAGVGALPLTVERVELVTFVVTSDQIRSLQGRSGAPSSVSGL